jgi:phosphoribosylamine---glycine ligase
MRVLVLGSGGREYAIVWIAREHGHNVICAPGNAGTARIASNRKVKLDDFECIKQVILKERIELVIPGPEDILTNGIVDFVENDAKLKEKGVKIFGPKASAAVLEGSKVFTKLFSERHKIPTAGFQVFENLKLTRDYILKRFKKRKFPLVIKVDGLAQGKGVGVCRTLEEAEEFLAVIESGKFGKASERIVVEDFLEGEEATFIVMVDANGNILSLDSSQDHKAVYDGDKGPNTGGMGVYSPAPVVTREVEKRILERIIYPAIRGMAAEGRPFVGFLYAGLMVDKHGDPHLVEFNVRLGDPEAEVLIARMKSDLVSKIMAALSGNLDKEKIDWDPRPAVGVILATKGYPGEYGKGFPISGINEAERMGALVFHAGTRIDSEGRLVTAGGRVLVIIMPGESYYDAQQKVYQAVDKIKCDQLFCRRDIGWRAIAREKK